MSEDKLFETPDEYCLYWKYCGEHACYCPLGGHSEIDPEVVKRMTTWTDEQQKELEELERDLERLGYYDEDDYEDNWSEDLNFDFDLE
jgi:hypothetical protein